MDIEQIRAAASKLDDKQKIELTGGSNLIGPVSGEIKATNLSEELVTFFTHKISALALGCTFSPSAVAAVAKARTSYAMSRRYAFSGIIGAGLIRSPFELDAVECFSEDACLTSALLSAYVKDAQIPYVLSRPLGQGGYCDRVIDGRALEELWLYPFRSAVKYAGGVLLDTGSINGKKTISKEWISYLSGEKNIPFFADYLDIDDGAEAISAGAYMLGETSAQKRRADAELKDGKIDRADLDRSVERILTALTRANNFYKNRAPVKPTEPAKLVRLSSVLLKNDGILPLKDKNLRLIGTVGVTENSLQYERDVTSLKGALRGKTDKTNLLFIDGSSLYTPNTLKDLATLSRTQKTICVLLNAPMPLDFADDLNALLFVPYAGNVDEIVDILLGEEPLGRLPFTWARATRDYPKFRDKRFGGEFRYESVYNGYRYFSAFGVKPLFAFGSGLSYAEFEYSDGKVTNENGTVRAKINVTNKSDKKGSTVLMMFITREGAPFGTYRTLAAFTRVEPDGGKTQSVSLAATPDRFSVYENGAFVIAAGKYTVEVGTSADNIVFSGAVNIKGEALREKFESYTVGEKFMPTTLDVEKLTGRKYIEGVASPTYEADKRVKKLVKKLTAKCNVFDSNRKAFMAYRIPRDKL